MTPKQKEVQEWVEARAQEAFGRPLEDLVERERWIVNTLKTYREMYDKACLRIDELEHLVVRMTEREYGHPSPFNKYESSLDQLREENE